MILLLSSFAVKKYYNFNMFTEHRSQKGKQICNPYKG